jgi:hypothetical protein
MEGACRAAGVKLGAYDERILLWRAGWERAHRASTQLAPEQLATVFDALDVGADYKRDRAATCPDCDASRAELCGTCEWHLARADEYDALRAGLSGGPQ